MNKNRQTTAAAYLIPAKLPPAVGEYIFRNGFKGNKNQQRLFRKVEMKEEEKYADTTYKAILEFIEPIQT